MVNEKVVISLFFKPLFSLFEIFEFICRPAIRSHSLMGTILRVIHVMCPGVEHGVSNRVLSYRSDTPASITNF